MSNDIPYGFCQCGCGQQTEPAKCSRTALGQVKGEPLRFIQSHRSRIDPLSRFWPKVNGTSDGCWLWTAHVAPTGYGMFLSEGSMEYAHRWAYEHFVGLIPEGMELDHLC